MPFVLTPNTFVIVFLRYLKFRNISQTYSLSSARVFSVLSYLLSFQAIYFFLFKKANNFLMMLDPFHIVSCHLNKLKAAILIACFCCPYRTIVFKDLTLFFSLFYMNRFLTYFSTLSMCTHI